MSASEVRTLWLEKLRRIPRRWLIVGVAVGLILLVAYAVAFLIDEPLRRYTEAKMNRALKGYTVHITRLNFHPVGFSLDLMDTVVTQDAHPDPPIARIPLLSASVHWRALLHGRVVGDFLIDRPTVHLDLQQARKEIADPTPVKDRGWQDALEAIYPLKINQFRVKSGDLTYVDQGPFKPLRVRSLNIVATNIRNVASADRVYPSPVRVDGAVFEKGRLSADGRADFLAKPNPTFRGNLTLQDIELDYFKPITNRYNVTVDKGLLSAEGMVESGHDVKTVELTKVTISDVRVDYVHTLGTAAAEQQQRGQAAQAVKAVNNAPDVLYKIDELRIVKGTFGYVNKAVTPTYRVFLTDTELTLNNLSNHKSHGPAKAHLKGKFMGSGTAIADATFRAETAGPAFDVSIRIDDVELPSMNDLLRAYGKFDVVAGRFFFYSELSVRDGAIGGYVKPFFKDMVVYDPRQDKDKTAFRKVYERVVGGVAKVLENRPREEVATKTQVSGRLDNPKVGIMEVVVKLVENAFFKAILPGFDREVARTGRHAAAAKGD
jgi:uncharacterized protein DUF748